MKTRILLIGIFLLAASAGTSAQKSSASAYVRSFYDFHRQQLNVFEPAEVRARRKWFSPVLNSLFQNELRRQAAYLKTHPDDKPFFGDGFPFQPLDECDMGSNSHEVGEARMVKGKSVVDVSFYSPDGCGRRLEGKYSVELIRSGRSWLINDWIYEDGSRLTTDLRRKRY